MLLSMYQCTLYLLLICICVNVSLQQDEAGAGQCVEQEDGSCVATSSPPEHAKKTTKTYPPFTLQTSLRSICTLIGPCGEVNRFDSTDHALNRYLRDRQPVLLGGGDSVASKWKALKWNLWYWASKTWTNLVDVIELHQEKDHTDGVILIRDQTEAAETSYSSFQALEVKEDILLWDYLNDIPQHNHSEHYLCRFYSTDYLEMENMAKLQADSTWRDLRITEDIGLSDKDTKDLVESIPPLFNFLYPGCTLQGRYQDYHMVRVQILGSAKYYLVPPKKISEYLPFPFTHSASRQSQVNLRAILALGNIEDEEEDYEMSERTMFLQQVKNSLQEKRLTSKGHMMQSVVVNAGETLFIPPGYMVYSEAIFPSVFLDVLSPSKEQILLMEAMMTPVPMQKATVDKKEDPNKSLTADEQIIFTQVFLVHVLSRIQGISSIGRYTRKLYKSRYESLYPMESLHMQKLATEFNCYKDKKELHDRVVFSMNPDRIESVASFVAKRFNDPALQHNGIKWVWLSDYVDSTISKLWDGERLDRVALFLNSCLDMDSKIQVVEEELGPSVVELDPIY